MAQARLGPSTNMAQNPTLRVTHSHGVWGDIGVKLACYMRVQYDFISICLYDIKMNEYFLKTKS